MGTDIHCMAEIRYGIDTGHPHWSAIYEPVFENMYYESSQPIGLFNYPYCSNPYQGRNYVLFSFLADVRNGFGFAGVDTGDPITPLADPRGVPEDASEKWREYAKDGDLHSHSWFTLAELKAVDWNQPLIKRGVLEEAEYLRIQVEGGTPQGWSGDFVGDGILVVTPEEYQAGARGEKSTHVRYQWSDSLAMYASWFLEHTIPGLERLAPRVGEHPGYDNLVDGIDPRPTDENQIRLVFAFDN